MDPVYDSRLVVLSVVVAIGAAYTALSLAGRMRFAESSRTLMLWAGGGAIAMGFGIWSMHFIGMLAMTLPIPLAYAPGWTAVSLAFAIGISGLALHTVHVEQLTWRRLFLGAIGMAAGICVMHYVGMGALRVAPDIDYDPTLFIASVLIALVASFIAILVIRNLRSRHGRPALMRRIAAAVVLGMAISGMHFTGMAAAQFDADAICTVPGAGADRLWLSTTIAIGTAGLMAIAILSSIFDARLQSRTRRLNRSLTEANQRLARLAMQDALTGLPNRALLLDRLELALAEGSAGNETLAVLFIDLDRFKAVNDTLGHRAGDQLLITVAARFEACLRPGDTLARLGSDEFVALLRNLPRPTLAAEIAGRMLQQAAAGVPVGTRSIHVAMSIGIAVFPADGRCADELLAHANAAMIHAKQRGHGGFQFFAAGMNDFAHKRFEIENDLRRAIPAGELVLHYQPKVNCANGAIESVEALVRWQHPVRGLLGPAEFIAVAEDTGLIDPLGDWVLREACRQNMAWQRAGFPPMRMAVNLSARQFGQHDLVERIVAILRETGTPPGDLELELTESALMGDAQRSVRMLDALDRLGVQIAIDDFGTGYSSLAYLKRLPLHYLKVDRSFVREIASGGDDEAIARAVVSMAHSLRLKVIAEGVETPEQHALLRQLGCDQFQGYYFSPPVPAAAFAQLLAAQAAVVTTTPTAPTAATAPTEPTAPVASPVSAPPAAQALPTA